MQDLREINKMVETIRLQVLIPKLSGVLCLQRNKYTQSVLKHLLLPLAGTYKSTYFCFGQIPRNDF